jgi:predicted amidohydrolase YtcJ
MLIIYSGHVFTGLHTQPWAEAVGIQNDRIAAVGVRAEVKAVLPHAEILELPGRLITPGLVDGHCHFISYGRSLLQVDLRNQPDLEACRRKIRQAVARLAPGQWLLGRGWNHHQWSNPKEPGKQDLDDIVPDHPVMMARVCGHSVWVNSRALKLAGITKTTADPPGGRIDRDAAGIPTGLLRAARQLIDARIPPPTLEEDQQAALAAQADALRSGLTGVHTCETLAEWRALAALDARGELKIRVHHLLPPADLAEAEQMGLTFGGGSNRLWIGHQKLFADGSLGAGTALLKAPYSDDPANFGLAYLTPEELEHYVADGYARGFSSAIHAIGDQAGTNALDAFAAARKRHPGPWRDRIEHVQLHNPRDLTRYQALNVTASVQPAFVATDWPVADRRWGAARRPYAYGWKTLLDQGIRVQFGSDAPVEPIAPLVGLRVAMLRRDSDGQPEGGWRPDQCLSFTEGLCGYFQAAAWTAGRENVLGAVAPGYWADLTIFKENLHRVPPQEWPADAVEMTVIGGRIASRM